MLFVPSPLLLNSARPTDDPTVVWDLSRLLAADWEKQITIESTWPGVSEEAQSGSEQRACFSDRPERVMRVTLTAFNQREAWLLLNHLKRVELCRAIMPLYSDPMPIRSIFGALLRGDSTDRRLYVGGRVILGNLRRTEAGRGPEYDQFETGVIAEVTTEGVALTAAPSQAYQTVWPAIEVDVVAANVLSALTDRNASIELLCKEPLGPHALPPWATETDLPLSLPTYSGVPIVDGLVYGDPSKTAPGFRRTLRSQRLGLGNLYEFWGERPRNTRKWSLFSTKRAQAVAVLRLWDAASGSGQPFVAFNPLNLLNILECTSTTITVESVGPIEDWLDFGLIGLRGTGAPQVGAIESVVAEVGPSIGPPPYVISLSNTIDPTGVLWATTAHLMRFDAGPLTEKWMTSEHCAISLSAVELLEEKDVSVFPTPPMGSTPYFSGCCSYVQPSGVPVLYWQARDYDTDALADEYVPVAVLPSGVDPVYFYDYAKAHCFYVDFATSTTTPGYIVTSWLELDSTTVGPTCSPATTLTVVVPNGGESYLLASGFTAEVAWTNLSSGIGSITVALSEDAGTTWVTLGTISLGGFTSGTGTLVTDDLSPAFIASTRCLIRATLDSLTDNSDAVFSLTIPTTASPCSISVNLTGDETPGLVRYGDTIVLELGTAASFRFNGTTDDIVGFIAPDAFLTVTNPSTDTYRFALPSEYLLLRNDGGVWDGPYTQIVTDGVHTWTHTGGVTDNSDTFPAASGFTPLRLGEWLDLSVFPSAWVSGTHVTMKPFRIPSGYGETTLTAECATLPTIAVIRPYGSETFSLDSTLTYTLLWDGLTPGDTVTVTIENGGSGPVIDTFTVATANGTVTRTTALILSDYAGVTAGGWNLIAADGSTSDMSDTFILA